MCFPFSPRERQHINKFDPTHSRDNPEKLFLFNGFSPPKNFPKMPVWDPQNEFPAIPWIGHCLGIAICFNGKP